MKVIFFGSKDDGYYCLQHLLEQGHHILAVVTVPDPPKENQWYYLVRELARQKELPLFIPAKMKDKEFLNSILELRPDVTFSVNFDKIIPEQILRLAKYNINFHGGILPQYSGCVSGAWSIINGETETASTAHLMEPSIDTGDIIKEKRIAITGQDTGRTLYDKTTRATIELFKEILELIEQNQVKPIPQELEKRKYYGRELPFAGIIDWNNTAIKVYNIVRALNFPPFKPAKTYFGGNEVFIERIELSDSHDPAEPGTIVRLSKNQLEVATKDKNVIIKQLAIDNQNLTVEKFVKNYNIKVGDHCGGIKMKEITELTIGNRKVGSGHPVFIIAEAGVNHDGDVEVAKRLVDIAAEAGADAVKFQSFVAERLNTRTAPKARYHIETTGSDQERSWFDRLKKEEFKPEMHYEIAEYCRQKGIMFLSTPYDEQSADLLEKVGVAAYKIASTDVTNIPLLKHIAAKKKPVILSTAMSNYGEVEEAVAAINSAGNNQVIILQCIGNYPPAIEDANLAVMAELKRRFKVPVGYSDNGPSEIVPIAATALGSCLIEKHFTISRRLPGPDHRASVEPEELKKMVTDIRLTEKSIGSINNKPASCELENIPRLRKSIVAVDDLPPGTIITRKMIMAKRPALGGLHPRYIPDLVGKQTLRLITEDEQIHFDDLL